MTAIKKMTVVLMLLWSASSWADFYCGTHLIEQGMTTKQVVELCGQPTKRLESYNGIQWFYDLGPGQMVKVLHVTPDGKVTWIEEKPRDDTPLD